MEVVGVVEEHDHVDVELVCEVISLRSFFDNKVFAREGGRIIEEVMFCLCEGVLWCVCMCVCV